MGEDIRPGKKLFHKSEKYISRKIYKKQENISGERHNGKVYQREISKNSFKKTYEGITGLGTSVINCKCHQLLLEPLDV